MDPKNILVVGVKGSLTAFEKTSGRRLWSTKLKSGDFVSVLADESRVYAHTGGEMFCLNLFSGERIWADNLPGLGYGLATLAIPGMGATTAPAAAEKYRQDAQAASTTHATGASH